MRPGSTWICYISHFLLLLFLTQTHAWRFDSDKLCRGTRPGDCDPSACGGPCEAKYIRFYDRSIQGDRTAKSCECIEEKVCSIIGMHAHAGCRSYAILSTAGQRLVRLWSMDARDRKNRHSNDINKRFSDKRRHHQLLNGNSRFCCRSRSPFRPYAMRLSSSSPSYHFQNTIVTAVCAYFIFRL